MSAFSGEALRKKLEMPLEQRGVLFFLLLPLLYLVSVIWALIAAWKRSKGYACAERNAPLWPVICVGNVIVGGTGKSPLTRFLAQRFLERGFSVAIFSRGISNRRLVSPLFVFSESHQQEWYELSDENREHFYFLTRFLRMRSHSGKFALVEYPDRHHAMQAFVSKTGIENERWVLILDDGLQHFAAQRDVNICLWSGDTLQNSPKYSLPLGPFREGWGATSLRKLMAQFDFNVFSALNREVQDVWVPPGSLCLKTNLLWFSVESDGSLTEVDEPKAVAALKKCSEINIVTGFARPERLFNYIQNVVSSGEPSAPSILHQSLSDHSELDEKAKKTLESASALVLSTKDFFRWFEQIVPNHGMGNKIMFVCTVESELTDLEGNSIDVCERLLPGGVRN